MFCRRLKEDCVVRQVCLIKYAILVCNEQMFLINFLAVRMRRATRTCIQASLELRLERLARRSAALWQARRTRKFYLQRPLST